MNLYCGKNVTIMGLGLFGGGAGAARYFAERGARVTVTDLRPAETLRPSLEALADLDLAIVLGEHRERDFAGADIVVVNPAVPREHRLEVLAREAGARIEREANLVLKICRQRRLPVVAVTGSNGKSTTTALVAEILTAWNSRTVCGGNIGRSVLCELDRLAPGTPVVLELSSFQLECLDEIGLAPQVAVVTNLTPNHLDRHGSCEAYARAKRRILAYQEAGAVAVLNRDDPATRAWAGSVRGSLRTFSLTAESAGAQTGADTLVHYFITGGKVPQIVEQAGRRRTALCRVSALRLPGRHNLANALAACAAARAAGAPPGAIRAGLASFRGLPHRLEPVGSVRGVDYYNDSIATTPESVICALEAFERPITLIAGGYDKGVSFAAMGAAVRKRARRVILLGKTAEKIAREVSGFGFRVSSCPETRNPKPETRNTLSEIVRAESLEAAVCTAAAGAVPGEMVLLSPGCASYDMFVNFAERGERFRAAVNELGGGG